MYVSQRLRYRHTIENVLVHLEDMALPGVAARLRQLKSSASTPSLRSRESELVPMTNYTPNYSGGNVKVVVRVRGFLERGNASTFLLRGHS